MGLPSYAGRVNRLANQSQLANHNSPSGNLVAPSNGTHQAVHHQLHRRVQLQSAVAVPPPLLKFRIRIPTIPHCVYSHNASVIIGDQ